LPLRAEPLAEPVGERAALVWDAMLGKSYSELMKEKAWEHFAGEICGLRDLMVARLVNGSGDQDEARATAKLIDKVLTIPVTMIQRGHESEQDLKRMAYEGE